MANRRDLHIGIDGDSRGLEGAFERSEDKARGLDKELAKLERQQAANEKVTTRAAAAVDRFAKAQDKASLAAHRLGLDAKRAAEQAEKAEVRAAAAAEAAAKGLLDEEKAARLAARADDAVERAALKAAEAQLAQATAAKKLANEERKAAEAAEAHRTAVDGMRGGMLSAGAAAGALAVPVGAAGLAFVGMAAVAAPAVAKVIAAQADLGANWDTLDHDQKIAAVSVASLITRYKALAKSYEPDALRTFNGLVSTARGLLPQLGETVDSTKVGVADFASTVETSLNRQIPRLASILQGQATPALHELGTAFDETGDLAVNLLQGLAPMGLTFLHGTNGILSMLNALTAIDPRLTEFAAATIALRGPVTGLAGFITKVQSKFGDTAEAAVEAAGGLGTSGKAAESTAVKVGALATKSKVAAAGTKLLNAAVGGGPGIYIAAAAGLAYLAVRMSTVRTAADGMIDRLRGEYQAFGNNIKGYQQYSQALRTELNKEQAAFDALKRSITNPGNPHPAFETPDSLIKLRKALDEANTAQKNVTQGAQELSKEFGVGVPAAIQLANAAGVDLSKGVLKNGELTEDARQKITQYEAAVAAAANPTERIAEDMKTAANTSLLMKDRVTAVTDALSAYYAPASAAWNATTQLKTGMDELAKAMKAAKGDFSGNTAASAQLRQALDQELNAISQLYQANLQTRGYQAAHDAAESQVQVMYALAGRNKEARAQVDALAKSLGLTVGKSNLSHTAFLASAKAMGIARDRAEALWRAYNRLPSSKTVTIFDNAAAAKRRVDAVKSALDALHNKKITITTYYRRVEAAHHAAQADRADQLHGSAKGGYIHRAGGGPVQFFPVGGSVFGPGTSTSDSIPAMLSNGEYVINARATAMFRPLLDAINYGQMLPASTAALTGASGGSSAPAQVNQTFVIQSQDPAVVARQSARETAWLLRG